MWVSSLVAHYLRVAGVRRKASCHAFRRTCATEMLRGGAVERSGDEVQLEGITKRIEKLEKQLASTTGLRGRFRLEGDDVEKARVSVTKNVNRALDNIKKAHEPLWRHLDANIDKGRDFIYKPEKPPVWQVNEG